MNTQMEKSLDSASKRTLRDLPGPRGLPLLGNILQVDSEKMHVVLDQWTEQFGPIYTFKPGPKPVVVISDGDLQNQILLDRPDNYRRMGTIEPVCKEMGMPSLFSSEGDAWRYQRRLVMQTFNTRYQRYFFPTLTDIIGRLRRRWTNAAQDQVAVDVQKDLLYLALDVIANFALGHDINSLEKDGDEIHGHLHDIFVMLLRRTHAPLPYWRYVKLPVDRKFDKSLIRIHKIVHKFIAQTRQRIAAVPELIEKPTNFLETMLVMEKTGQLKITDEEIVGNVLIMLVAGEDAVANAMAWVLYYMCAHLDIQGKMQAEVDSVLKGGALEQFDDIKRLKYIDAVVNESLRLHPADHTLFLETNADVELGNISLPKGIVLFLPIRSGMVDKHNFGSPHEFRPERWLTTKEKPFHGAHNRKVYIPFGNGPRICPGRSLSYLEIKATIAMVCRHFDISFASDPQDVHEDWGFIMTPRGISVRFTQR